MGFSWKMALARAELHQEERIDKLCHCNLDFQVAHPNLVKEATANATHVERKKFVKELMAKRLKYARVPKPSVIIKRYNRVLG